MAQTPSPLSEFASISNSMSDFTDINPPTYSQSIEPPKHLGKIEPPKGFTKFPVPDSLSRTTFPDDLGKVTVPEDFGKLAVPKDFGKPPIPDDLGKVTVPENFGKLTVPEDFGKVTPLENFDKSNAHAGERIQNPGQTYPYWRTTCTLFMEYVSWQVAERTTEVELAEEEIVAISVMASVALMPVGGVSVEDITPTLGSTAALYAILKAFTTRPTTRYYRD